MPIVSIILSTYKNPKYLTLAIKSVLEQSFTDWELIIVDDGLVGKAKQIVFDFVKNDQRIVLLSNSKNLGIQKSLNNGLAVAKGRYIARIDDDDIWTNKDKLKKQVEFFDNNPDYVLVGTDAIICDENLMYIQSFLMSKSDLEIRNRILFKNCFLHSTVLMRKSALEKVGRYIETKKVRHVEDYDLWLRLGGIGKLANLNFESTKLIVSSNSITAKSRISQAHRDLLLIFNYRKKYPYFLFGFTMGCLRVIFFYINAVFPIPKKVLYKIQALYKAI